MTAMKLALNRVGHDADGFCSHSKHERSSEVTDATSTLDRWHTARSCGKVPAMTALDAGGRPLPSVLFEVSTTPSPVADQPDYFPDLNLDQVMERVTAGREEYDLTPFFFTTLSDVDSVASRHDVFRDLDGTATLEHVRRFARGMRLVRERLGLAEKLRYRYQKQRWVLDAATAYAEAVTAFSDDLTASSPASDALVRVRDYLHSYTASDAFIALNEDLRPLHDELDAIVYCTNIQGLRVEVSKYEGEPDYSTDVLGTFEKFKQGIVESYRFKFHETTDMDHVEERIHDLVVELFPETFARLDHFCDQHRAFLDPVVARFDREIQFYVAYLECIEPLRNAGLPFCYPRTSQQSKHESATDAFDLALALRLIPDHVPIVCNDVRVGGPERILVVTGPNQGGKTTYARMYGQLHHLAALGCPVPGQDATLFLPDTIFTHFEKEEDPTSLVGKLEDDLLRVHAILGNVTSASVVILNEVFNSTTLHDATFLGTQILDELARLDTLSVCVTFVDELASLNEQTVSMVSMVDPDDVARRTYKVIRKPADGLAHAVALAEKYGLTFARLKERIAS